MGSQDVAWHYTFGFFLNFILKDGALNTTNSFLPPTVRPCVWFSLNDEWEPTTEKTIRFEDGSLVEFSRHGDPAKMGGLVRIGVSRDRAPVTWERYKVESGERPRELRALE